MHFCLCWRRRSRRPTSRRSSKERHQTLEVRVDSALSTSPGWNRKATRKAWANQNSECRSTSSSLEVRRRIQRDSPYASGSTQMEVAPMLQMGQSVVGAFIFAPNAILHTAFKIMAVDLMQLRNLTYQLYLSMHWMVSAVLIQVLAKTVQ